ncbi:MAG: hypothetical protein ACJA0K_000011 [Maricaulis maris]|jgi:uncharacterized protein involved in response to NO
MNASVDRGAKRRAAPAFLQNAFRPFFLGGAIWAACLVPLWVAAYLGWIPTAQGVTGHAHEMLYGFLAAIVCGFALTAIPNWTGRAPVAGSGLAMLFLLWLAGRAASLWMPGLAATVLDVSFLVILSGVVFREIIIGRNWRNLPIAILVLMFALSHLAFHHPATSAIAIRASFAVSMVLISLIGGRIIPSFTRNWLAAKNAPSVARLAPPMQGFDKLMLALTGVALVMWIGLPDLWLTGLILVVAGLGQLLRQLRWQWQATLAEPLVWSLHAGFFWLSVSLGLVGVGIIFPAIVPPSAGLHAIAAGLVGAMTLAVMTRATLGHTGRSRSADGLTTLIYTFVHAGAALRVLAALNPTGSGWLIAAALLWSSGFLLFAIAYAPMLVGPKRVHA